MYRATSRGVAMASMRASSSFSGASPEALDSRGIHVGEIEVADLLRIRTGGRFACVEAATMSCFTSSCAWSSRMMNEP